MFPAGFLLVAATGIPVGEPGAASHAVVVDTPPGISRAVAALGDSLAGLGVDRGAPEASVVVVEFADFGCGYCAQFARETFPSLDAEFIATGRVRWRFVPFRLGAFAKAEEAARAALCAAKQGAFWPMHDLLFARRASWSRRGNVIPVLRELARTVGLDDGAFTRCLESDAVEEHVERSTSAARRLGVRGTPTFFVNGKRVVGALPLEAFRQLLLAELEKP